MKKQFGNFILAAICMLLFTAADAANPPIAFCGSANNDLFIVLKKEGYSIKRFDSPEDAIKKSRKGSAVFIVADGYPAKKTSVSSSLLELAKTKNIKLYIEYPSELPGISVPEKPVVTKLERGIVVSSEFGGQLPSMSLLGINDCHVLDIEVDNPLIVIGKVAGFDKAEYGISDVETYPVLFRKDNMMVAMTKLTNFATGRYGPEASWKKLWEHVVSWMTGGNEIVFKQWLSYVTPTYSKTEKLPSDARIASVKRGAEWFRAGKFFIDPQWKDMWLRYQGDGTAPFGPPVSGNLPVGDGTLGILEGHSSRIFNDGSQEYRYWIRNDVQGEVCYALAAAADLLDKKEYDTLAAHLADFIFHGSNLRGGAKNDPKSPVYGLVGWSVTHPHVFYSDDNARSVLGLIGASAYMKTDKWDKEIVENILANFRTTGKNGFNGDRLEEQDILRNGIKYYQERDLVNPHPHFESWIWATYLWLYDKTKYAPLLEKTEKAIRLTMEAYPDDWKWTNGIQQERARMILPLAWLVRVDDTKKHRQWLDQVVNKLLENQEQSGAIREELGGGKGMFGKTASNKDYGLHEAPLIFENGDKVADMLYTSNFAFFSLNEAAQATGDARYKQAVKKLSDFLTRIQVKSERHKDINGAWFRAFDYGRWDYWASNADAGWGAWATLTGWIQSWIISTQVLVERNESYWELTRKSNVNEYMKPTLDIMWPGR